MHTLRKQRKKKTVSLSSVPNSRKIKTKKFANRKLKNRITPHYFLLENALSGKITTQKKNYKTKTKRDHPLQRVDKTTFSLHVGRLALWESSTLGEIKTQLLTLEDTLGW